MGNTCNYGKATLLDYPKSNCCTALTECGTAARMNGIGKVTAINQQNNCSEIKLFGEIKGARAQKIGLKIIYLKI